ncbi:RNA-guided endonuclease InsQ/TnpB family protein [Sulfuricystis multivorans]|uniref:RNA-guided endonuclease InsQ/TnpB family protein n=1 Tax=Sulfuricystis multivorans TaxID=2211108 RepID=UPI000F819472|nr:RNA-guided endonuclease TnpB family protein [Sulfuricystis multivorans]
MKVQRAYRYRFYPTPEQEEQLAKTFGCVRSVYNWGLERRTRAFYERKQRLYYKDLALALTALKKTPERAWLNEVSNVALQQALRHLDRAFANFFAGRAAYPTFKSKRDAVQSASYMRNGFTLRDGKLTLAKQDKPLDVRWSRPLPNGVQPSSVTVTRTSGGRYYVSLLVEEDIAPLSQTNERIGLDFNAGAIVDSKGRVHRLPQRLNDLEARKRRYQRAQRRKITAAKVRMGLEPNAPLPRGARLPVSNNLRKASRKVGRVQEHIAAIRSDWQHKLTTSIVRENQVIAIEDLALRGMTASARGTPEKPGKRVHQKAGLNRAVLNMGFAELRRQLEYKAQWYGREVIAIDRWYPSSKRCSACGYVLPKLALSARKWTCPACGQAHDRDLNAAKNILAAALAIKAGAAALRIDEPRDSGG